MASSVLFCHEEYVEQEEHDVLHVLDFALPLHQTVFYKKEEEQVVDQRRSKLCWWRK